MHDDEVLVSEELVRALLRSQFPEWSELPVVPFAHGGTDHFIYRLGDELQVRLPKHAPSTGQVEKEQRILPRLAPHLPVAVPEPIVRGEPGEDYPFTWGVYRWLPGEPARKASVALARDVASFLHALQQVPVEGEGPVNSRGAPLARRDRGFRESLARLADEVDRAAVASAWDAALAAPEWNGAPVLSLLAPVRDAFRSAAGIDEATWARARGWALSHGVTALGYYLHTNPPMVEHARSAIAGVLADTDG